MEFGQSSEVFVPMAMARGHQRADIEVVVGYQPVWCIYPMIRPFQHPYEAPSSGAGQDRETDVWCFTLAYAFPNRKVKSGVGKLREGSLVDQYVVLCFTYTFVFTVSLILEFRVV